MIFLLLVVGWDVIVRDVLRGILASVPGLVKSPAHSPNPHRVIGSRMHSLCVLTSKEKAESLAQSFEVGSLPSSTK